MGVNCAIQGCVGSYASKHRFPNPDRYPELFQRWVEICGRPEYRERPAKQIFANLRVCRKHFTEDCFGRNNTLLKTAYPTLLIPEPLHINAEEDLENIDPNIDIVKATSRSPVADGAISDACTEPVEDLPSASGQLGQPETLHCGEEIQTDVSDEAVIVDKNQPGPSRQAGGFAVGAVTPHRKRKHEVLKSIAVRKAKDLSPKSKYLYRELLSYRRKTYNRSRKLPPRRKKASRKEVLSEALSSMDRVRARFFECQIENQGRDPHGHRFLHEDKILGLVLQKHCGSGYQTLRSIFDLPSPRTLHRLLEGVHIKAGLNTVCFELFKSTTFTHPLDKYCTLIFDEMSISPQLQFNGKDDVVQGFEEFGYRSTKKIANHVQVFMLRGIRRKWKQPVYFNSVYGATSAEDIIRIIKLIVWETQKCGLQIIATVCDQGTNNVRAITNLLAETRGNRMREGVDCQDPTFNICGMEIIPLFDVPHIFKCIRNNFIKYSLHFHIGSEKKTAKWDHIYTAYKMDPYIGSIRSLPRLTDSHLNKEKLNKMKVSHCTQVLSHSVAKAINLMAFKGMSLETSDGLLTMPHEAVQTAECCQLFDDLFDSMNGSTVSSAKQWKKAVKDDTEHIQFWNKCLKIIDTMYFVDDETQNRTAKKLKPPTLKNLCTTINNFKLIWTKMKQLGFPHMMPRTFNQDPIENFFGQIRQRSRFINPTFSAFGSLYKSLLIKTITSKHSIRGNCQNDNSQIFFTLNDFLQQGNADASDGEIVEPFAVPDRLTRPTNVLHRPILSYVSGYICKKIPSVRTCEICSQYLLTDDSTGDDHMWTRQKEIDGTKRLTYVNNVTLNALEKSYSIILYMLDNYINSNNIRKRIICTLYSKITFEESKCAHGKEVKLKIFNKLVLTLIHNYIKQINRIIHGKDLRQISRKDPAVFQEARSLYLKYKKR